MAMDRRIAAILTAFWLTGAVAGGAEWVVDPGDPGPDMPPVGRSLFDHLVGNGPVPFPLEHLLERIEGTLDPDAYLDQPLKRVLIPLGRSLQREAGAPAFFRFPRAVAAVDGEPADVPGEAGLLLRDRLYIGYLEKADVLEVISYNEQAARFEFQVVRDYREDGVRRVTYAPRALCGSCHQNASPIFARPLWDETNANDRVAALLAAENKDLYGFPVEQGVDMAYAIDSATDRANGFSLTQRLWLEGCGSGEAGRRCRGELTLAALRHLLSGKRSFGAASLALPGDLVERMRSVRAERWPDGLLLPDPDIPNRRPLERVARLDEPAPQVPEAASLFGESSIPSRFEPLAPRPPVRTWNPTDAEWAARAVQGIGEFLARQDLRRLDAYLIGHAAPERELEAECQVRERMLDDGRRRLKLACAGEGLSLSGRIFQGTDGRLTGRVPGLNLEGFEAGALVLSGQAAEERLDLTASRSDSALTPRLSDGSALSSLTLVRDRSDSAVGRLTAHVRDDFRPVANAVEALVAGAHQAFAELPFQRALVLPGLFEQLGMARLAWCCLDHGHLPPPATETAQAGSEIPGLGPFYQVCARCHRTAEPFPPNFLAGPPEDVSARVVHCAERIAYRLGMWELGLDKRPKTPMPPQYVLQALGTTAEEWPQHPTLSALRKSLSELGQEKGEPLPEMADLLARDYKTLRPCLPGRQMALSKGERP